MRTTGLVGRKIEINLINSDGLLSGKNYSAIDLLQDGKDVNGLLSAIVGKDGLAIYKVNLQPTNDSKGVEKWNTKLNNTKEKKTKLCILVNAHTPNKDLTITYLGKNPKEQIKNGSQKSKEPNYWQDGDGKWFELTSAKCYCLEMGLTTKHCGGKGTIATKDNYKTLAKDLAAEEAAVYAVSKQESTGGGFMQYDGKNVAKILYERHYMYNNLKSLKGEVFAEQEMSINKYLVNNERGRYIYNSKGVKQDNTEIASREKLSVSRNIDENSAIKSCSWGSFQIMGQYFNNLYKTPQDLEKAQDMCELQQIAYFKAYLLEVNKNALKALRNKNWEQFTRAYNGPAWKENNSNYPINMKKYYEEYK